MFEQLLLGAMMALQASRAQNLPPAPVSAPAAPAAMVSAPPAFGGTRMYESRPSARHVRSASRVRGTARKVDVVPGVYANAALGIRMRYPRDWSASQVMQQMQYTEVDVSDATRVVIFRSPDAVTTEQGNMVPVLPVFEHSATLVTDYTDLNTISLSIEDLGDQAPSLQELTEAYLWNLELGEHDVKICDCDRRLGGNATKLVYHYDEEGNMLMQTWTIIGGKSYLLTASADAEHADAVYSSLLEMISSFRLQ